MPHFIHLQKLKSTDYEKITKPFVFATFIQRGYRSVFSGKTLPVFSWQKSKDSYQRIILL